MIFSEVYSTYYGTVAKILNKATRCPLSRKEMRDIIEENAFGESVLNIEPAITEEKWQLIRKDGSTPVKNSPTLPMTTLQKRWLKAIFLDPRIRLFTDGEIDFEGIEPLFTPEDISVFDKYSDGDPYDSDSYIKRFRLILDAVKNRYPLSIDMTNRKGNPIHIVMMPEYLESSEKDDKFRLIGSGDRHDGTVNLGRIISCEPYDKPDEIFLSEPVGPEIRTVVFELIDERNALERVLMHFAHFEKQAEKIDENRYKITITYEKEDKTEVLIRILSFGPMVRVTAPQDFMDLIKERLIKQKNCEQ